MTDRDVQIEDEDAVLAYVQGKRKEIVEALMKGGVPTDADNIKVLLSGLKDMDMQALGKKRIKADIKVAANQEQVAALIAHVLGACHTREPELTIEGTFRVAPSLPSNILPPILVEGEIGTEVTNITYDSFMGEHVNLDE